MSRPLIAKLLAPRTNQVVRRPRINAAIDAALQSGRCWVAAPGGYGKTTALADYLQAQSLPHIWYRADDGDQDIASFFHYLAQSARHAGRTRGLPVFGPEYADQPQAFARRFFRAYFAALPDDTLLVIDDLHYADAPPFRAILAMLLRELPDTVRCACLSRTLPPDELNDLVLAGQMAIIDQAMLEFSDGEARAMIESRKPQTAVSIDFSTARGWAVGLVLLAQGNATTSLQADPLRNGGAFGSERAIFAMLQQQLFDTLPQAEQDMLLQLSLLPEITADLAAALAGTDAAHALLARLHQRQLLVSRGESTQTVFRLHDLLRDFLQDRLAQQMPAAELARLRERSARLLHASGRIEAAIDLALQAQAWTLAREWIAAGAGTVLAQGRRATLIDWCARLPDGVLDAWLCYWLGVAHMADDATAERWLSRAWDAFAAQDERRGQCLAVARAVLTKTDSWRTHSGLSAWTQRALQLAAQPLPALHSDEDLLVLAGLVRAFDFAEEYHSEDAAIGQLEQRLLQRLAQPQAQDTGALRLLASYVLIDRAGSIFDSDMFEQAVDSVIDDLRDERVPAWTLGLWLVAFGATSGRYFPYTRRDFPHASAEDALRAASAIGERECLRGVEFGALYHLQLQMKQRNDWAEFEATIARLAQITDSRSTTQVAVVADCQAALHTMQGNLPKAYQACERFMAAVEAANEPPIERWPHYITHFQVLLADRRAAEAAQLLEEKLSLFDGAVRARTEVCIIVARALQAHWSGNDEGYFSHLRTTMERLRVANCSALFINLPSLAAQLCADALAQGIEPEYVQGLIARRRLAPPAQRPKHWPWALRVHVLGEFQLQRNGAALDLGAKPPARSLDIIRVLAIASDHTCSLENLYDWLWPDADGDNAKASCEQALHRLRKLLGGADLVVQREGKLRLARDKVWVDLEAWELGLKQALTVDRPSPASDAELERVFFDFTGPLLLHERATAWSLPAAERVRSKLLDLAIRLGKRHESAGDFARALTIYLRTLDFYPASTRLYEALIRARLAQGDRSGALEAYARFERIRQTTLDTPASAAIRSLVAPLLNP